MQSPEGEDFLGGSEQGTWELSDRGDESNVDSSVDQGSSCTGWYVHMRYIRETLPPTLPDGFTDDGHLQRLQFSSVAAITDPFLVTAASMALINDARLIQKLKKHDVEVLGREACAERSVRSMKLELPLLRSDENCDNIQLMRRVVVRRTPNLADHHLPLEPVDIERDEGLEFPSRAHQHADTMSAKVKHDTIDVSRDTMAYLAALLKSNWTHDDQMSLLNSEVEFRKNPATAPFTPPISPKLTSQQHWVPPEEVCSIPLCSDPSSGISADINAAEAALFKENGETWSPESGQSGWPDLTGGDISLDLPEEKASRHGHPTLEEMKLELPVQRAKLDAPAVVPIDMEEVVGSLPPLDCPESQDPHRTKPPFIAEAMDEALEREFQNAETYTMRSIEQEKLVPLDALARAPVPIMDFSISKPAWQHLAHDGSRLFAWIRECNSEAFRLPRWPRNKHAESMMVWAPVSSTAVHISLSESIEDHDGMLETTSALHSEADVYKSEAVAWKSLGLDMLREDEDEDEDEIVPISLAKTASSDLMKFVHKKSSMLEHTTAKPNVFGEDNAETCLTSELPLQRRKSRHRGGGRSLLMDDQPAMSKLLDNFMLMNAPNKRNLEKSSFFSAAEPNPEAPESKKVKAERDSTPGKPPESTLTAALAPPVEVPPGPIKILVSVALPRAVLRGLEEHLPGLQLVDRDLNAHNESVWYPGSVCRSEISPPLADEADITISAATGIILTSMVKVRQKPVPGADTSMLRSRVEKVGLRHERLLVLVSEGNAEETAGAMAPQAAQALAELQGYVQSLESAVVVLYVPGGQAALAKWAAALICQYHHEAAETSQYLIETETYWELFLRQAGMNAYAAQVIAGMLQAPDAAASPAQSGLHGLPAFVQMSQEERVGRFSFVLGGRKVLDKVGTLLDAGWQ